MITVMASSLSRRAVVEPDRKMLEGGVPHRHTALNAIRILTGINHFEDEQSRECIDIIRRFIDSR